jgi:serine/threonine-protein kinase RsbW
MQMNEKIFKSENYLKSEKSSITLVEPILEELRVSLGIKDENFYNVMIAVTEAVNNAINHGNKLHPEKTVHFLVEADDETIFVLVEDQGNGFNPTEVADCLDPENLLKSSGRGVFIIRELMDRVNINSSIKGTTLEMYYDYHNK